MQKIQILFPDPTMERMREVAKREDVPLSDLIRRAMNLWLERLPQKEVTEPKRVPVVDAGRCLLGADAMKEALHE